MSEIAGKKIKLFSLSSNQTLASDIAKAVGLELSRLSIIRFADGEITIDIKETVRGHHVFVVQSTSHPANDNIMELLIMCDALKRASAASINIVMPYYGYSRQDRKSKSRQPISAKLVADIIQAAGANRVIAMDLHAAQIQGFFNVPIDNFPAQPKIVEYFKNKDLSDFVVVSPDHGGTTRARSLADKLHLSLAIIDKRRPEPNKAVVMNIIGEVKDKNVIIIDDMVDTAGTLVVACNALKEAGCKKIYAACTHAVLSREAPDRIQNSVIEEFICTDTIELPESKKRSKIVQLKIGDLFGEGILKIIHDEPISDLFQMNYE